MNISKIIKEVSDARNFDDNRKLIKWICDVDRRAVRFASSYYDFEGHEIEEDSEYETFINGEDSDIYFWYCLAQVDISYGETTEYINDMQFYNSFWEAWQRKYNSSHKYKGASIKI